MCKPSYDDMNQTESQPIPSRSKLAWCHIGTEWLLLALLVAEGCLFMSGQFRSFANLNLWPLLLALGSVVVGTPVVLLWFGFTVFYRRRSPFTVRTLLLLIVAVVMPAAWLAIIGKENSDEIEATERAMAADKDDKPSYEAFVAAHTFPYSASVEKRNRITNKYGRLRVGLTKAEVAAILGDPDCSDQSRSKGPRDEYLGSSWTYYLAKPDYRLSNLKDDKTVEVFFGPTGKVHWVVSNIDGLEEIGKPGGR